MNARSARHTGNPKGPSVGKVQDVSQDRGKQGKREIVPRTPGCRSALNAVNGGQEVTVSFHPTSGTTRVNQSDQGRDKAASPKGAGVSHCEHGLDPWQPATLPDTFSEEWGLK